MCWRFMTTMCSIQLIRIKEIYEHIWIVGNRSETCLEIRPGAYDSVLASLFAGIHFIIFLPRSYDSVVCICVLVWFHYLPTAKFSCYMVGFIWGVKLNQYHDISSDRTQYLKFSRWKQFALLLKLYNCEQ